MREVNPYIVEYSELSADILRPELLAIQLDKHIRTKPIYIGSICYTRVKDTDASDKFSFNPNQIIWTSFQASRRELVRNIVDRFIVKNHTQVGLKTKTRYIINTIRWLDANGFSEFHQDIAAAKRAYIEYTAYLRHRILSIKDISPTTASSYQRMLAEIIEVQYGIRNRNFITTLTYKLSEDKSPKENDFSEVHVKNFLAVFIPLIRNLAKSLMHEDFPFAVKYADYEATFFPHETHGIESTFHKSRTSFFDFKNKKLKSKGNIYAYMVKAGWKSPSHSLAARHHKKFKDIIENSNSNKQNCLYRSSLAQKVIKGYATILGYITGANPSQIIQFEYSEALELIEDSIKKELSGIKLRAGGKQVRYPIGGKVGLKILNEYLTFRKWHLGERGFKYLFFKDQPKNTINARTIDKEPKVLRLDFSSANFNQLKKKLFPADLQNISFTTARKFKSAVLHQLKTSPSVVASVLNHTPSINAQHYQNPSIEVGEKELGNFWRSIQKGCEAIKVLGNQNKKMLPPSTEISVGHCLNKGQPSAIIKKPPIPLNCKTQYGCLYCEHYLCHADEVDIWKLLSIRYVLKEVTKFSPDYERASELFDEIRLRITALLDRIRALGEKKEKLVEKLSHKVDELGVLTPFWESRLSRYEQLGLVL